MESHPQICESEVLGCIIVGYSTIRPESIPQSKLPVSNIEETSKVVGESTSSQHDIIYPSKAPAKTPMTKPRRRLPNGRGAGRTHKTELIYVAKEA